MGKTTYHNTRLTNLLVGLLVGLLTMQLYQAKLKILSPMNLQSKYMGKFKYFITI